MGESTSRRLPDLLSNLSKSNETNDSKKNEEEIQKKIIDNLEDHKYLKKIKANILNSF